MSERQFAKCSLWHACTVLGLCWYGAAYQDGSMVFGVLFGAILLQAKLVQLAKE